MLLTAPLARGECAFAYSISASFFFRVRVIRDSFVYDVTGPPLGFKIYFPDVLTDHPEGDKLDPAQKADDTDTAGPSAYSRSEKSGGQRPDNGEKTDAGYADPQSGDDPDRLHTEAGNAVEGQQKHFFQRVMAFPCQPCLAVIVDRS